MQNSCNAHEQQARAQATSWCTHLEDEEEALGRLAEAEQAPASRDRPLDSQLCDFRRDPRDVHVAGQAGLAAVHLEKLVQRQAGQAVAQQAGGLGHSQQPARV